MVCGRDNVDVGDRGVHFQDYVDPTGTDSRLCGLAVPAESFATLLRFARCLEQFIQCVST